MAVRLHKKGNETEKCVLVNCIRMPKLVIDAFNWCLIGVNHLKWLINKRHNSIEKCAHQNPNRGVSNRQ